MENIAFLNIEYFFLLIYRTLTGNDLLDRIPADFSNALRIFQGISTVLSLLLLAGLIYSLIRLYQLNAEADAQIEEEAARIQGAKREKNPRWSNIVEQASSTNPNDWRQAVLEADILLDDMLTNLGYVGAGVGEKLKTAERGDFSTLDLAWEAHKVRNQIAHQGTDFLFTQREARRAVDLFRQVFEEFGYI